MERLIQRCAAAIRNSTAIVVTAGAGMGVDSGLPDFRGKEGFWEAYPPLQKMNLGFTDLASGELFWTDRTLAWGFYGHRMQLYRSTTPHKGFSILKRWCEQKGETRSFVFTSNVDGQFERAGFASERVVLLQQYMERVRRRCPACGYAYLQSGGRVYSEVPSCSFPSESELLGRGRPSKHIDVWRRDATNEEEKRFSRWISQMRGSRCVVIELGAGKAVPTVRMTSEDVAYQMKGVLIRINPRDYQADSRMDEDSFIGLPLRAQEGLEAIDAAMVTIEQRPKTESKKS